MTDHSHTLTDRLCGVLEEYQREQGLCGAEIVAVAREFAVKFLAHSAVQTGDAGLERTVAELTEAVAKITGAKQRRGSAIN